MLAIFNDLSTSSWAEAFDLDLALNGFFAFFSFFFFTTILGAMTTHKRIKIPNKRRYKTGDTVMNTEISRTLKNICDTITSIARWRSYMDEEN